MKRSLLLLLSLAAATPVAPLRAQQTLSAAAALQINIEEPADWQPASSPGTRGIVVAPRSSIRVSGTAKHPNGIAELLLDGNRASVAPTADGGVRFIGYVLVKDRMNSAEITAVTRTGEKVAVKFNISPTAPPPAPAATPQEAWTNVSDGFQGKRWAVVIGISDYKDPDIRGLQYADRDAKSVYDFLRSDLSGMGGFAPENIRVLLNEDATYQNIRVALFDFLKNAMEEDVVYIYFAGHGAPDPERLDNLYLIPYDANSKQLGGTGFPMEDLNKALRQVPARYKILITDACHSGGVASSTRSLDMNQINEVFLSQTLSSTGVHVTFTASGQNQVSFEGEQWGGGHGVFTHYLLDGLKGAADDNKDHIVSIGEAMEYTRNAVRRDTRNGQIPVISTTAYDFNFPVAMVLPGAQVAETSIDEIRQANLVGTVMTSAYESAWVPPDSVVTVVGGSDTLTVRLANERKDAIPPSLLAFTSSNTSVLEVDANGVLTGVNGGTAQVKVEGQRGLNRSVTVTVRVLPRPSQISWAPATDQVQLVVGEALQVRTDLLMGTDRWMRGLVPKINSPDSVLLRADGSGRFMAEREGETRLVASIGGQTKEYTIRIIPPHVKIKALPVALAVGDSFQLAASRTRPDGVAIGDAGNVTWSSSDTTRAVVRGDALLTKGIGKVTLHAQMGDATDSVTVFVLGDLLVGVTGRMGETIVSVAVNTNQVVPLLPEEMKAGEPALSPRGDMIAFVKDKRLHVMEADGANMRRLTPDMNGLLGVRTSRYEEHTPRWTHDGSRIVFVSNAHGNYEILSVKPDGTDVQRLTNDNNVDREVAAATDQPRIAFERMISADDADIVIALPDGSGQIQFKSDVPASLAQFGERKPQFIANSPYLAFVRRYAGRDGEALAILDVATQRAERDIVRALKGQAIIYSVAPDGKLIAFHQYDEWSGSKEGTIVLIDLEGKPIKTLNLGNGVAIRHITWGARPLPRNVEAK